ncbi:GGDEF domain-containing protein [Alteromonas gilva]|uniref:diguanylate cyclase n=1 Tax=Alteromonas gilva TaxID=2987522 RepID=A0ABT5L035_9ALTE|nr:GGDEF domain-containing protein [Alteromonas gilva]MDC8830384.1 GGDEF domain-containing protein [Alteromonas gilva]
MDTRQIQTLRSHSEQLAAFIIRLSTYYEGISVDIDKELGVLRHHLSAKADYTLASISINKLNQLLMLEPVTVKTLTQNWLRQLTEDIHTFQRLVTDQSARELAVKTAAALEQPSATITTILPLYEKVLQCYKVGLSSTDAAIRPAANDSQALQLKQNLVQELEQLVQTYVLINPQDDYLASLHERLGKGLSEEELLSSCLILIRVMAHETIAEANNASRVIQRLCNALHNVSDDAQNSIAKSTDSFDARQNRHLTLQAVITKMEDAVANNCDVDQLKQQTQLYLDQLAASLNAGEQADRTEQECLVNTLVSMQQQLKVLQRQTDSYRKKLIEQRVNMYTDPLTKIPNRMAYNEKAEKEWQRCQRADVPLCIAILDVDHFKRINDQYGHAAGDKSLQAIARHLKSQVSSSELLARWGGEEFVMLLPGYSHANAPELKNRLDNLRKGLSELPFKFKHQRLSVTVSIGVAFCQHGESLASAFERADKCLYQAKSDGRNKIVLQDQI